jgi:rRNA biogenesis protein RRP5
MFPRGSDAQGATSAAGKGHVKDSDALFGTGAGRLARMEVGKGSKPKKGTAKKGSDIDAIEMSLNARVGLGMVKTSSSKAMKIDRVAPTKFQIGTQALGYVLQLSGQRAIISLPGGCVGTVQLSEVSDVASSIATAPGAMNMPSSSMNKKKRGHQQDSGLQISDLLKVNQVVRVHVLGQANNAKGKKNDIILSMRSSYINRHLQVKNVSEGFALSGCVASKEDHGYVISTGIAAYSFFMPVKNVDKSLGELVQGKSVFSLLSSLISHLSSNDQAVANSKQQGYGHDDCND